MSQCPQYLHPKCGKSLQWGSAVIWILIHWLGLLGGGGKVAMSHEIAAAMLGQCTGESRIGVVYVPVMERKKHVKIV